MLVVLGAELKFAGYDGIIIGRVEEPTYIIIFDGVVEFHKADHLWGVEIPLKQRR